MTSPHAAAEALLRRTGWLSETGSLTGRFPDDLLPALLVGQFAAGDITSRGSRGPTEQDRARLRRYAAGGARLTFGLPDVAAEVSGEWLGPRLIWWPCGIPAGRRVGFASSHLGRRLDRRGRWFRAFRAACGRLDPHRELIVTGSTTTTDAFALRAAALFGMPVLRIVPPAANVSPERWLAQVLTREPPVGPAIEAYVSPRLPALADADDGHDDHDDSLGPLQDRAVVAYAQRLLVFYLRPRGRLEALLHRRLASRRWPTHSMLLALDPDLVARPVADDLLARGALGWVLLGEPSADESPGQQSNDGTASPESPPVTPSLPASSTAGSARLLCISPPPPTDWVYLTHCTRDQAGPWPDQSVDDYRDELLVNSPSPDRSALAALRRIVHQCRICATATTIRGAQPMVSFTAAPLADLPAMRVFRSHRSRWDFEPYGICIRRDWLQSRGVRPVIYGDETVWNSLPADERPFFQRTNSRSTEAGNHMDWSREREWRHAGDVCLDDLPAEAGFVFVPTVEEAETLLAISRWPVIVLDGPPPPD